MFKFSSVKSLVGACLLALFLMISIGFSNKKHDDQQVNDVVVKILNQQGNYFIDNLEVLDLINEENANHVLGLRIDQLNLKELERRVYQHPFVKEAQVFTDLKGNLLVDVVQTKPLARIYDPKGADYYIGEEGQVLPVTAKHTARVPLIEMADKTILKEKNLKDTEEGVKLFELITFLDSHRFWNAQVAHVFVSKDFEVSFLTQVSKQVVQFGPITDLEKKFKKLKVFYRQILPGKGWNEYDSVSIEFEKQIVVD